PHLCKVAPSTQKYHMEDVHRAGGVIGILAELNRAGLLNPNTPHVSGSSLAAVLEQWDLKTSPSTDVQQFYAAGPAGIRTTQPFSQHCRYPRGDDDRAEGCIRSKEHAYSQDGGFAVLFGNLAPQGCIVKAAGVEKENLVFTGRARVF